MSRNRQLMFLLGVACLTTAVVSSSAKEKMDTKILSHREVSRSEPPPQSETSFRSKSPLPDELVSQNQSSSQSQLSTRNQLTTRFELTTRSEPSTQYEFSKESEPPATARVENLTRVPCSSEDNTNEATVSASTTVSMAAVADGLREQVMRLTNALSKAVAAQQIAQQRERNLSVLERQKYSYLKAASEKVLGVVDNVQHSENGLVADTNRERQIQERLAHDHRTHIRSRRKLQVIGRLMAGAEVGLVHIQSSIILNRCRTNSTKSQCAQHADKSTSRNHTLDELSAQ